MICSCPVCGQTISDIPVTVYPERGFVVAQNKLATLTGKEMLLVEALVRAFPKVLTKQQIMDACYSGMDEPEITIVDVFVCKTRKKLDPLGVRIDTSWGVGYGLGVDVKPRLIEAMQ